MQKKGYEFKDDIHDIDSCMDVWDKLYKIVYRETFGQIFDFDNLDDKETRQECKRWYAKINTNTHLELRKQFPKFKIAGDCDFNFNSKKIDLFTRMINRENDDMCQCTIIQELLNECALYHHQLCNFSFMPITGGLQLVKGRGNVDRFDKFIYILDDYYKTLGEEKEKHIIFSSARRNREALKVYLDYFKNIETYCSKVYLINDEDFIEELIHNGAREIKTILDVKRYLNLAIKYWKNKTNILENTYNISLL